MVVLIGKVSRLFGTIGPFRPTSNALTLMRRHFGPNIVIRTLTSEDKQRERRAIDTMLH